MTTEDAARPLLVLQIDGLARPTLVRALRDGRLPAIANLVRDSHELHAWCPSLPSQTSACQAGILFGDALGIPAFRWYQKDRARVLVSNHPADAAEIERRAAAGTGLLALEGSSVGNLLSGGAPLSTLTMSTLEGGRRSEATPLLESPRFWAREIALMTAEIGRELVESTRQRLARRQPRVSRLGSFPFLRAVSTVLLRDLTERVVAGDVRRGVPAVYADFVGYDLVAHHAGPETPDAIGVLERLDRPIARLLRLASRRGYATVLVSDHGQSPGQPFGQRYGRGLGDVVGDLSGAAVSSSPGGGEPWGHLNRVLSELVRVEHALAPAWRLLLRPRLRDGYVETGPDRLERRQSAEIVVCESGNLAHVYLTKLAGRADGEAIRAEYPRLIDGLADHPGIDFVLLRENDRPLVLSRRGRRWLDTGEVDGEDPLTKFPADAADHLRSIDRLPEAGDLVLNGRFDPADGSVISFEDLVGCHGGLGGRQLEPFLLTPAGWRLSDRLEGPAAVYRVLREHLPAHDTARADGPAGLTGGALTPAGRDT